MPGHVHNMKPFGKIYKCNSCEFKSTQNALSKVNSSKAIHVSRNKNHPQSKKPYNV